MAPPGKKVALILCGCGVYDGSETTEVVSTLIHLSRAGIDVSAFAPNINQSHVVNHKTGNEVEGESRNVLVESAHIMRGNVDDIDNCNVDEYDGIILPGGFGAAKNLSNFATKGAELTVHSTLENLLIEFHKQGKPIGCCCIAPTIISKVLGGKHGCKVTVGSDVESDQYPYAGAAGAIQTLGAKHELCKPNEACVDSKNKIVSSAAYMYAGKPCEIDDSVKAMVDGVLSLM